MDAVAFPPPPPPFLDDADFDFGDFAFASPAISTDPHPAFDDDWGDFVATSPLRSDPDGSPSAAGAAWEKPRGPLPLSLFGADEEEQEVADEGATADKRGPRAASNGSKPADLKDLIAGLYGSQAITFPDDAEEEDDGFGDDGWEFKAAPSSDGGEEDRSGRAHGDGVEDVPKSMGSNQEDWSLFTSVDENHVQATYHIETRESTGQSVKIFTCPSPNNAAILDLYKDTELVDAVHMTQSYSESVQSSSDMFSNNEMLREESLAVISRHKDFKETSEKLQDSPLPNGFRLEELPGKDVCIAELLNSAKEDHLKDFEKEYHLTERIAMVLEDMSSAVELYKHSVSTLHTLEQASKEEQCDYVRAWYSMLLYCAQELQHGVVLWQESCETNVCDIVISQGGHYFIALGEVYRVAQILRLSLQTFKPWVLADPGMLSKMLVCSDGCLHAWTSGLGEALRMVIDSKNLDAPVAKVLLESIIKISGIEVVNLQSFLPNSKMTCRLTLLPTTLVPGMEVIIWDGDHYFVKVANLWANEISSDPPQFSVTRVT
uniref:Synergin gamma C-terminal domain-containing protein n=1 Tax=Leersia perrieri TaxID=77586 RepID=A0A0D9XWW3_9ORYZ